MATRKVHYAGSYDEMVAALIEQRHAVGLSQLEVDERAGLPSGYTGKIECGRRRLGALSLSLMLQALGLRLAVERDPSIKVRPSDVVSARGGGRTTRRLAQEPARATGAD